MLMLLVLLMSLGSAWYLGVLAFSQGMPVKRWAFVGALMGPVGYPLFTTHKRLNARRAGLLSGRDFRC